MLISNRCISGLMHNLIKKSWTISRKEGARKIIDWAMMTPRYVEWRESKTVKQECHVRKHLQYLLASVSIRVNTTKEYLLYFSHNFQAFWKLLLLAMIYYFSDINTIRHGMIFWQNICWKSKYWPNRWKDFIVIKVKQSGNQIWVPQFFQKMNKTHYPE